VLSIGPQPYFYRENAEIRDFFPLKRIVSRQVGKNNGLEYHKVAQELFYQPGFCIRISS
jgi:hypothetical protein